MTVAWRHAGATAWTPLGTDDNAPYRVFHDVDALPHGTLSRIPRGPAGQQREPVRDVPSWATVGEPEAEPTPGGGGDGGPVTQPAAVSMPGSHNSEIGCPGDWQPDCAEAQMSLDADDLVWKRTVALPAGGYEYKAAIDGSWDENYGAGGARGGADVALDLAAPRDVTFYYEHRSHWITSDANGPILTLAGSMQSDWAAPVTGRRTACAAGSGPRRRWHLHLHRLASRGQLSDQGRARALLAENYGAGGVPDGTNIDFDVPAGGVQVVFIRAEHPPAADLTRSAGAAPDLEKARAQWLRRDLVAWDVSDPVSRRFRLHWSDEGDLAVDAEAVTGGSSAALTHDPAGLPADVLADFPHLAGYEAFRLGRKDPAEGPGDPDRPAGGGVHDPLGRAARRDRCAGARRPRRRVRRRDPGRPRPDVARPAALTHPCGHRPPRTSPRSWTDGAWP